MRRLGSFILYMWDTLLNIGDALYIYIWAVRLSALVGVAEASAKGMLVLRRLVSR